MPGLPLLKAAGLQTSHNPFSGVSVGGLAVAKNVMVFSNHVLEPRRGHRNLSYVLSNPDTDLSNAGSFFGSTLIVHHDDTSLSYDTGAAFTTYSGTFTPPDDSLLRTKFVEARQNTYFTTATGVRALASASGTPTNYNLQPPRWSNDDADTTVTPTGDWIPNNEQVAFRLTYAYTDPNGNVHESEPSRRLVLVNNSGSAGGASLWWIGHNSNIDKDNTTVRFYRTTTSGGVSTDPGDEMFLFHEQQADDFDVSLDLNSYDFGQASLPNNKVPLYTNPRTGDGILQANTRPPLAKDIATHAGRMWYANTTSRQRFYLELLGTSATPSVYSLVAGDTITINGVTYTGHASATDVNQFEVFTGGTATENIAKTAAALETAINNSELSGQTAIKATLVSGVNDPPGRVLLEADALGASAFTVYSSKAACWNPILTTSSTGAFESDPDRLPHGLFYSKPDQPEAVPLINYLLIGAKNKEILRVIPLRDKLYVFKEDGIFTVAGDVPFTVDLLDEKTRLVCPDSACILNNQIICFTNQGVVAVSDAGVQILSRPIEDLLIPYLSDAMRPVVKRYAFGLAHETDRTYELWVPGAAANAHACDTAFVYSTITSAWTTWTTDAPRTWGAVSPTDVRYYGGLSGKVNKERRDFASTDYAEEYSALTINTYSSTTLTPSSVSGITVGDAVVHTKAGTSQTVTVTAVGASTITVSEAVASAFQSGSTVTLEKGIENEVKWLPIAFDRPGTSKRFQYGTLHFGRPTAFTTAYATYETDLSYAPSNESLVFLGGWGTQEWGASAWGDGKKNMSLRHTIPAEKQRASMLYPGFLIREAYSPWRLHGVTIDTEETSERNSK